jgi:hypothetical protein
MWRSLLKVSRGLDCVDFSDRCRSMVKRASVETLLLYHRHIPIVGSLSGVLERSSPTETTIRASGGAGCIRSKCIGLWSCQNNMANRSRLMTNMQQGLAREVMLLTRKSWLRPVKGLQIPMKYQLAYYDSRVE